MKSRSICYYALVLLFVLSGCAAPTISTTPPTTNTKIPPPTLTPKPTLTQTPSPTLTSTPIIADAALPTPAAVFPKACGMVVLGKAGTQSQDKTHPVLVQGTVILCAELFSPDGTFVSSLPTLQTTLDLDTGTPGTDQADIFFDVSGRRDLFDGLFSINGALDRLWAIGGDTPMREPTFDECETLSDLFWNDNEPSYVCVITNAGHVARIKVEQYSPFKDVLSIKISFITWAISPRTPFPTATPCLDHWVGCRVENVATHTPTP